MFLLELWVLKPCRWLITYVDNSCKCLGQKSLPFFRWPMISEFLKYFYLLAQCSTTYGTTHWQTKRVEVVWEAYTYLHMHLCEWVHACYIHMYEYTTYMAKDVAGMNTKIYQQIYGFFYTIWFCGSLPTCKMSWKPWNKFKNPLFTSGHSTDITLTIMLCYIQKDVNCLTPHSVYNATFYMQ